MLFLDKILFGGGGHGGPSHTIASDGPGATSPEGALVLLVAMGTHAFLEAMALGISGDKRAATLMAASGALHQPAEVHT